jgi:serine/threonine protein kinase
MYVLGDLLGKGRYSAVYSCANKPEYVIKSIYKKETSKEKFEKEIELMKTCLQAKSVVQYIEHSEDEDNFYIIETNIKGKTLFDFLINSLPQSTEKIKHIQIILKNILNATRELHNLSIVHHDIKPENVMINTKTLSVHLIDLGLSQFFGSDLRATVKCGSNEYMAPEKFFTQPYNAIKSDAWSIGAILYVLLFDRFPFSKSERMKFIEENGRHPDVKFPRSIYPRLPTGLKTILNGLLQIDPSKRMSIDDALSSKWMQVDHETNSDLKKTKEEEEEPNNVLKVFGKRKVPFSASTANKK